VLEQIAHFFGLRTEQFVMESLLTNQDFVEYPSKKIMGPFLKTLL